MKTGHTEREARVIVRKHLDSTLNGLAAHVSGAKLGPGEQRRVMPLLNKLSDVTLTKCPEQAQQQQQATVRVVRHLLMAQNPEGRYIKTDLTLEHCRA